jgi:hypothetical protein
MATPGREYSLDHHLLERMKFAGMERENLADLVSIVVSLKNKYGLMPFTAEAQGHPVPNTLAVRYIIDTPSLNKIMNILADTPRLNTLTLSPRGIPKSGQYEITVTLGG